MTRERSSHQQKTWEERRNYLDTTVRQHPAPTVDEADDDIDSTETTQVGRSEPTHLYRRTKANPYTSWLHDHWFKLLGGVAGTIFVSLVTWMATQLYSLNREVGEIRTKVEGNTQQQGQMRTDFEHLGDQMRQEMDRMNDRLNSAPRAR